MNVNKVIFNNQTLIDLTDDTVTPETLAEGYTAHNAAGNPIVGTMKVIEPLVTKSVVLKSTNWSNNESPYSYTLNFSEVNENSIQIITPPVNVSSEDLEMLQAANIQDGGQTANGEMTILAYGDKPTANLSVRILIVNI